MKHKLFALLAASLLAAPTIASAMPILFDWSGTFESGSLLSGTLTIDTATGVATATNVIIGAPASLTFNVIEAQGGNGVQYQLQVGDGGGLPDFNPSFPVASLVGFTGGNVCSVADSIGCTGLSNIFYSASQADVLLSGSITMRRSVPEPAALSLLGLAAVAAWLVRRRKTK